MLVGTAVGLAASVLVSGIAVAQKDAGEVSVTATRIMSSKTVGRTSSGVPIVDVSMSYTVSFQGLNLASAAGAAEAEKRVKDAALSACKDIGRQYPDATPSDAECARITADKAMVRVHEMVAAAGRGR
jgi:UrcA family protein